MEKLIESVTIVIEMHKNYLLDGVLSKDFALGSVEKFVNVIFCNMQDPEADVYLSNFKPGLVEWAKDIISNLKVDADE